MSKIIKESLSVWLHVVLILGIGSAIVVPILIFSTEHRAVVVCGLEDSQLARLVEPTEPRLEFHDTSLAVVTGSVCTKVIFSNRIGEGHKVKRFMDSTGLDYTYIGKVD